MLKVKIIALGRMKEPWLNAGLAEYEKRTTGKMEFSWIYAENNETLISYCRKEPMLVALDIQGQSLTSEEFSLKWSRMGARSAFVIGGPEGLPQEALKIALWRWSLSKLTFTNQMVRLLLLEQLYRALEIQKGSPYHK